MNLITVNFTECSPAPANGYNIQYREAGTVDALIDAGNFTSSPAVIEDDTYPDGTQYEGFIRSDCTESGESGSNYGSEILWSTLESGGGAGVGTVTGIACGESSTITDILFNDVSIPILSGSYPVQGGDSITLQPTAIGTGVLTVKTYLNPLFRTNSVTVTDSNGTVKCMEWYNFGSTHDFVFNDVVINDNDFSISISCDGCP